jgi:hypothetical protein
VVNPDVLNIEGFNIKKRLCLGCLEWFLSTWAGHRFCEDCKQKQKSGIDLESYRERLEDEKRNKKSSSKNLEAMK